MYTVPLTPAAETSGPALLGNKGYQLTKLLSIHAPVPDGFIITTQAVAEYRRRHDNPDWYGAFLSDVIDAYRALNPDGPPAIVSVRSSPVKSMPGILKTIPFLGINLKTLREADKTGHYDIMLRSYAEFIAHFDPDGFQAMVRLFRTIYHMPEHTGFDDKAINKLLSYYMTDYASRNKGASFPQNPELLLMDCIEKVIQSWDSPLAQKYRKLAKLSETDAGMAVVVQVMKFGEWNKNSGTGIICTRNPVNGENTHTGEYLIQTAGDKLVSGRLTPSGLDCLKEQQPENYQQLMNIAKLAEKQAAFPQELEFTIEDKNLFILQTRDLKMTENAALTIYHDLAEEGMITKEQAIQAVNQKLLDDYQLPVIIEPSACIAKGIPASPGAISGKITFKPEEKDNCILVSPTATPKNADFLDIVDGILTTEGGLTCHMASLARHANIPCITGCYGARIHDDTLVICGHTFREGDYLTIDGTTGTVYAGQLKTADALHLEDGRTNTFVPEKIRDLINWRNEIRKSN